MLQLVNFVVSCQRLNSAIIYDRDFSYNYFGFKVKSTLLLGLLGSMGMLVGSSGLGHRRGWDISGAVKMKGSCPVGEIVEFSCCWNILTVGLGFTTDHTDCCWMPLLKEIL